MKCEKSKNSIMKYIDKDINDIEYASLKQHLKGCESCNNDFKLMREAIDLLESENNIYPPEGFEISLMEKIEKINIYSKNKLDKKKFFWFITGFLFVNSIGSFLIINLIWNIMLPKTVIGNVVFNVINILQDILLKNYKIILDIIYILTGEFYYIIVFLLVMFYAVQKLLSTYMKEIKEGLR